MQSAKYFQNSDEFLKYFDFDKARGYSSITKLTDTKVGFSVQKNYPEKFRFYPARKRDGSDDFVAIIHIIYHPNESKSTDENKKIPLILKIACFSRYRNSHFDYDFDDPECPTKESLEKSNKTPRPVDLENLDGYFFDHEKNTITNTENKPRTGIEIIEEIYAKHCDTVHLFKGFKIRSKLRTRSISISTLKSIINLLVKLLKYGFGRTLDEKRNVTSLLSSFNRSDLKKLNTDSIQILNYKASKSVVVVFSSIIVFLAVFRYFSKIEMGYVNYVFSNQLITLTHGILLLVFLDNVFPWMLFLLLNGVIKLRSKFMFKKLKF